MDKNQIIEMFYRKGVFLTPNLLEHLESLCPEEFEKVKKRLETEALGRTVLGIEDLKKEEPKIKILKNITQKKKEIKTEDFVNFYQSKYNKMKDIITQRIKHDFVSIDKLGAGRKEVLVIGIVRDVREKDAKYLIELEDLTGTTTVVFPLKPEDVETDDVIAVKGISAGKILYGKEVMFPDIPLRSATKGEGKACFISDLHLNQAPTAVVKRFFEWFSRTDISYLFVAGDIDDAERFNLLLHEKLPQTNKKILLIPGNMDDIEYPAMPLKVDNENVICLSNPAMVMIGGLKILIIHSFNTKMLKKRYLGKSSLIFEEDMLVLEHVPDIVHCGHTHTPLVQNYKSVTIINSGSVLEEFKPVVLNFATRDVQQLNIDKLLERV